MKNLLKIFKSKTAKTLLCISFLCITTEAFADKLPLCSASAGGSTRCICEGVGLFDRDKTCEVGFVCEQTFGESSIHSRCVSAKVAQQTSKPGLSQTLVSSNDTYKYIKEEEEGCNPASAYKNMEGCLFCPLFKVAFNAVSTMSSLSFASLSGPAATIMIMLFGLWIAMTILNFVSSSTTQDGKDLIMQIINKGFVVLLCFVILKADITKFYGLTIEPVFTTGLEIARATVNSTDECIPDPNIKSLPGGLPASMGNAVLCTLESIQNKIANIVALGQTALCLSWEYRAWFIPQLGLLISGLGLWIAGMVMIIAFPFIILDAVLMLGIGTTLFPAAIAFFPFKKGIIDFSKKVWEMFLNSTFQFIFVSIIVMILTEAMGTIITGETGGDIESFVHHNVGNIDVIYEALSWTGVAWLKICFVIILVWTLLGKSHKMANMFASSIGSMDIGKGMGAMAASATASGASSIMKPTASALGSAAKGTAGAVGNAAREKLAQARISNAASTQRKNGGQPYTNYKGQKVSVENGVMTKTNKDGSKNITTAKATIKVDKNGNIKDFKTKSMDMNMLVNSNGNLDPNFQNTLFNVMQEIPNEYKGSVMSELNKRVIQKRIPNLQKSIGSKANSKNTTQVLSSKQFVDDDGNTVIHVIELERDSKGLVGRRETKTIIDKKGRTFSEVTFVDAKTNKGKTFSSNGSMQKVSTFNATLDNKGAMNVDQASRKTDFALADNLRGLADYELAIQQRKKNMNFGFGQDVYNDVVVPNTNDVKSYKSSMYEFRK